MTQQDIVVKSVRVKEPNKQASQFHKLHGWLVLELIIYAEIVYYINYYFSHMFRSTRQQLSSVFFFCGM
jgi:predicted Na+-dependent transporter